MRDTRNITQQYLSRGISIFMVRRTHQPHFTYHTSHRARRQYSMWHRNLERGCQTSASIPHTTVYATTLPRNLVPSFGHPTTPPCTRSTYNKVPLFMGKIIQMFDVFNIRFGATLVGPTGAGKTTCYRMLAAVMTDLRNKGSTNPDFQVGGRA